MLEREARDLPQGVRAGIGPTGSMDTHRAPLDLMQRRFEVSLDCVGVALPLPPSICSAVVGHRQF